MRIFGKKKSKDSSETVPELPIEESTPQNQQQDNINNNKENSLNSSALSSEIIDNDNNDNNNNNNNDMMTSSNHINNNHHDELMMMNGGVHPEDEISVASGASEIKAWDEGGSSDCGYSETFHHVFMTVGQGVHGLVGNPSDNLHGIQKSIGNWFQELSYATRDILRGENSEDMQEDAATAMRTLMGDDVVLTASQELAAATTTSTTQMQ